MEINTNSNWLIDIYSHFSSTLSLVIFYIRI